jgi:hypothetical protein
MKQQLLCRRIRLEHGRTVFTIAPAFVMPYMTGRTQNVDDALFLRLPLRIGEILYASPGVLAAAAAVSRVVHALPRY